MKITIRLLKPFSDSIGKKELKMDFNGSTLIDLLEILVDKYPKLKENFYTKNNNLTEYLSVFVNDKPISALKGTETELKNGDEILFFMPVSGG
jgi:MoaD family protein